MKAHVLKESRLFRQLYPLFLLTACAVVVGCGSIDSGTPEEVRATPPETTAAQTGDSLSRGSATTMPSETVRELESGSSAAFAYPAGDPPPDLDIPDYELEADGTVLIDGDQVTECHSFVVGRRQGYFTNGDQRLAQRAERRCKQAGFSKNNRGDMKVGNSEIVVGER